MTERAIMIIQTVIACSVLILVLVSGVLAAWVVARTAPDSQGLESFIVGWLGGL